MSARAVAERNGATPTPTQLRPSEPYTVIETVDEVTAYDYLETMSRLAHQNRRVSDRLVRQYAAAMARGEWRVTNQGIGFDTNGILRDGQHRMWAVITAKATIQIAVTRNMDPAAFDVIDTGKKRSASDLLYIHGEVNTEELQSALTWLYRFLNKKAGVNYSPPPSPQGRLALLELHPDIRQSVRVRLGYTVQQRRMLPAGLMGCLAYLFYRASPRDAQQYFEDLRSGTGMESDDPVLKLRDRLLANIGGKRRMQQADQAALCVKAWNLRATGKRVQTLSFNTSEAFPSIFGLDPDTLAPLMPEEAAQA